MLRKIITGGQTGVDRAALDVALDYGLEIGGWCPPGREALDGTIPLRYPLDETPDECSAEAPGVPRSQRTAWNVRDGDATLVFLPAGTAPDVGTRYAMEMAQKLAKPLYIVDPCDSSTISFVAQWISDELISILNVAGPAEQSCPGITRSTTQWLKTLMVILE
jgi:hypothetical protein